MDYYGNNDWRDYHLAHYGRKGMKKGKHLPGTDWWKDLKDFTGITAQQQAQQQSAIAQRQAQLAASKFAMSTQAYNANRSDKEAMRGERLSNESHAHENNKWDAIKKSIDAQEEYNQRKLSTRAKQAASSAKEAARSIPRRTSSLISSRITGSKYAANAKEAQDRADSARRESNSYAKDLTGDRSNSYYNKSRIGNSTERQQWMGNDTRKARAAADRARKNQKDADHWKAKYDKTLVGRTKKAASSGRRRLRSLFDR